MILNIDLISTLLLVTIGCWGIGNERKHGYTEKDFKGNDDFYMGMTRLRGWRQEKRKRNAKTDSLV